ncbi:MAG TPA: LytTR family DNA-binding domain-containing protein [Fibrobacteraceae bacterium]|nr:LytTR family DNA-binding domain-containing protein [Fibrobacteraceae bacterium]
MIRCIAIDDEPLALRQLAGYIQKTPFLELVRACTDGEEAAEALAAGDIDLMFADINMPGISGMDLVKSLRVRPMVIFTTAYSEYAVEGYKVDAQDYLLKPFGYTEFLAAAQKAQLHFQQLQAATQPQNQESIDSIWVKSEYRMVRIPLGDLLYVEGMKDYVRLHLQDARPVMTLLSLKALEDQLPANHFRRVHRSWIVNLDKVTQVEKGQLVIAGKQTIPLGDQYRESLMTFLGNRLVE